jgi:DNA polymerase
VRSPPPPPALDPETRDALAVLARGLVGAIEVAGFTELPRVDLAAPTPRAPAAGGEAPTTTATGGAAPATATTTTTTATTTAAAAGLPTSARPMATTPAEPAALVVRPLATSGSEAEALEVVRDALRPRSERLRVLADDVIGACTRCKLHRGRNKLVFGSGNPDASVVFVGEGPGADEDRAGLPFVGAAGLLLTKMIEAMGMRRDDVYIANVVKCRPPNNRDPEPDEVAACEGFLREQLAIVRPKVIVGLGRHACHTLLRTQTPISRLRGHWHSYEGVDFMPTYHPSYLLREDRDPSKAKKREAWSDLKLVMQRLGLPNG